MSLKLRLLLSIAAALVLALALGGATLLWQARAAVHAETRAAFQGAQDQVRATLTGDTQHKVSAREIVADYNGQRHVRATLLNENGKVIVASTLAPVTRSVPGWFTALIAPPQLTARIPIPLPTFRCIVLLQSDAGNEINEIWQLAGDAFIAMAMFAVSTFLLVWFVIGWSLRFIPGFQRGLRTISEGDYAARLKPVGPPEFGVLADGFNHMAARLSAYRQSNQRLQRQILGLQEEERAEIARDLHDEVGPYLFAIQVDADALGKSGDPKAQERASSIREAAMHIQRQVKFLLRQLRPVSGLAFGLETAIDDLIAFWKRRHPDIRFERSIAPGIKLDHRIEEAAYRIVQESVNNAVRHGHPASIRIALTSAGNDGVMLSVEDDGGGFAVTQVPSDARGGMGLKGMAERVAAVSGQFTVENRRDGVKVRAILPRAEQREMEDA